jgi:hypothetical protein
MSAYQTSASLDVNGEEIEPSTLEEVEILTPCFNNTYYVCYDAWNKTVYDDLVALADDSIFNEEAAEVYVEQISEMPAEETDLYGLLYDYVTGIA